MGKTKARQERPVRAFELPEVFSASGIRIPTQPETGILGLDHGDYIQQQDYQPCAPGHGRHGVLAL